MQRRRNTSKKRNQMKRKERENILKIEETKRKNPRKKTEIK